MLGTLGRTTKDSTGSTVYQGYTFEANAWGQTTAIGIANSANGSTWTKSFDLITYTYEDYATNTEGSGGGNLKQMKYGNDDTVDYSYDKFDRLISMVYNSGKYVTYTYNSEGDLAELKYGKNDTVLGVYRFEYDSLGRLIRSNEADGNGNLIQRTEHIYDEYSRLKSQNWIVGTTPYSESYTYSDGANGNGSLSQMTTATGATISYAYDTLQGLNRKTVTYGGTTIYTNSNSFHTNGSSTTMQIEYHNVRDAGGEVITGARYEYDALGNITKIYESEIAEGETARRVLAQYEYDDQNQLISETIRTYGTTPTTTTYTYTYDTAGNLITEEKNDVVTKTYSYSTGAWKDRLDSINGCAISYDAIGNPEVYRNGTVDSWDDPVTYYMDWENGRQLTYLEVWGDWQQRITYDYDADGIRTYKNVEGITHSYVTQNGKVVRETIGSGTTAKVLDFVYDESGKPFALIYTNGTAEPVTYYYVLNLQGDVVKLVEHVYDDDTDTYSLSTAASYTYNAWGEVLTATGTMAEINPLRYRGYYYDTETGFYYLQSRYYDPTMHRFINADSYASTATGFLGYNMFAYCENNPVSFADPQGTKIQITGDNLFERLIYSVLLGMLITTLTDDSLVMSAGEITIGEYCESPTHVYATTLIRELIESEETVYISLGYDLEKGSSTDRNENGIFVELDLSQNSKVDPASIILAHELIHALRHIQGERNDIFAIEEYETVGSGFFDGLTWRAPTYNGPTENRIRKEFGLPERTLY